MSLFAGAHDFVARDNTFIDASVSGMFIDKQGDGVGSVTGQHPQQLWQ